MELVKQFYSMFQLYFEKTYIIVVPTFKETLVHRHNMLHPAQTGVYQEGISCIKEDDVKLWFYTKNGVTLAIDAGHLVFKGIEEEFKKIGIDPLTIKTLLLTHSGVDHVGGVDRTNKKYLYPNAQVYIGKGEENYFDGHVCRMIKMGIPLMNPARLRDRITGSGVKVVCTGHSGIRTDMSKLFAHIDESAVSKPGKPFDPTAPKSIRFQKQPNVDQWNKKTYTLLV